MASSTINKEYTIESVTVSAHSNDFSIDESSCYKMGKLVVLNFRLVVEDGATITTNMVAVDVSPKPKETHLVATQQTWDGAVGGVLTLNADGHMYIPVASAFEAGHAYVIEHTYISQ